MRITISFSMTLHPTWYLHSMGIKFDRLCGFPSLQSVDHYIFLLISNRRFAFIAAFRFFFQSCVNSYFPSSQIFLFSSLQLDPSLNINILSSLVKEWLFRHRKQRKSIFLRRVEMREKVLGFPLAGLRG